MSDGERNDGIDANRGDADSDDPNATRDSLAERRGVETRVYQPAEDSDLLATAAVERARGRTLEVGTGSGWVAARVAAETDADVVASDLNPHACRQAKARADDLRAAGETGFDVVRADLFAPFADGAFDTVLFNPPYLPTDPDNEWGDWMEIALSGGESGRKLIDPFVDGVGRVLASGGQALLLVSSLSGYDEVLRRAESRGFDVESVAEESYPFETLSILRLVG